MHIRETDLRFTRRLVRRRKLEQIVIHHTASGDVPAETVHGWHLQRPNWGGIGYHYLVRANGDIERGRPEEIRGVHARRANANSIAIALGGNFSQGKPTIQQIDSLVWLVRDIRTRLPEQTGHGDKPFLPVVRHADLSATECPGLLFPWQELQKRLNTAPAQRH